MFTSEFSDPRCACGHLKSDHYFGIALNQCQHPECICTNYQSTQDEIASAPNHVCEHMNFRANVNVTRMTDDNDASVVKGYLAEVKIFCHECGQPFEFIGVGCGMSPFEPNVSVDGIEFRAPITPATGQLRIQPNAPNTKLN